MTIYIYSLFMNFYENSYSHHVNSINVSIYQTFIFYVWLWNYRKHALKYRYKVVKLMFNWFCREKTTVRFLLFVVYRSTNKVKWFQNTVHFNFICRLPFIVKKNSILVCISSTNIFKTLWIFNSNHWTQERPWHLLMEIHDHVLARGQAQKGCWVKLLFNLKSKIGSKYIFVFRKL